MCGIAGIYLADNKRSAPVNGLLLKEMTDSIVHRGPNEGSQHLEPGVGLGHRRLSIIDVATGQQPLFNEDNSVVVIFNGEIYNYAEVVPELERAGHVFRTKSDTEVIVHAWEQWGVKCLERFRGMFAFALWDRNQQTLFLARDRLGVKPLYYGKTRAGDLVFGSELKALLKHPDFSRELDDTAIRDYMTLGYVPDPKSIFKSIKKLPPANYLLIRRDKSLLEPRCYWRPEFNVNERISELEAQEEVRRLIRESVKLRMIAEVPLGAFLSGGVDSSVVVATMAGLSDAPVKTCSIGFDEASYDETAFAQQVATQYSTDHVTRMVTANDFTLLDQLCDLYDEPFADSSAIPTYRVCGLARERVTVALSGDGGDETFGGYRRYRFHLNEERLRAMLPYGVRRPVFSSLAAVYPNYQWMPRFSRARATFLGLAADSVEAYTNSVSFTKPQLLDSLLTGNFKSRTSGYNTLSLMNAHASMAQTDDPLSLIQYLDYQTYLPGDINVKVDRASMAHSLETREPLLDHKLIEFVSTLPSRMKVSGGEGKYILKKSYERDLPNDLLYRQKMGFGVPIASWFRHQLKDKVKDSLLGESMMSSGLFERKAVQQLIESHSNGELDNSPTIWAMLMLERFIAKHA